MVTVARRLPTPTCPTLKVPTALAPNLYLCFARRTMATRRLTRIKKLANAQLLKDYAANPNTLSEQSSGPSDHSSKSRPKKRRRATEEGDTSAQSTKRARKARMKLSYLPEMPLDILDEIFGYLLPLDILRLSWANKAFRFILLHRSSVAVWRSALSNFRVDAPDFPDTPFDLNEPQFISMMFSNHCHFCTGHAPKTSILWLFRIRCCKTCIPDQFDINPVYDWTNFTKEDRKLLLVEDVHIDGGKKYCVLMDAFRTLRRELPTLSEEEKAERRQRIARIKLSGHMLQSWQKEFDSGRCNSRRDARMRRKQAIIDKLEAGVWAEEFTHVNRDRFYNLSALKQSTDLTERSWKRIEPTLNKFMEAHRAARLKRERPERTMAAVFVLRPLLDAYNLAQPADVTLVDLADVCLMPQFKAVIADTPPDVPVTPESFRDAMEQLPRLSSQWREDATRRLREALAASSRTGNLALDLAVSVFQSTVSRRIFTAAEALRHHDPASSCFITGDRQPHPDEHFSRAFRACDVSTWMVMNSGNGDGENRMRFARDARIDGAVRDVVAVGGQDPETVTAAEMDALDPWVKCCWCFEHCPFEMDRNVGMHWRTAVEHALGPNSFCNLKDLSPIGPRLWRVLNEAETRIARRRRDNRHMLNGGPPLDCTYSRCIRCRKVFEDKHMKGHLKNRHGVENLVDTNRIPVSAADAVSHTGWRAAIDISSYSGAWYASGRA
ncbi:hypothetical protein PLICRDRAFT_51534 [Plicaturopsis crispa FD-325 SS-3]|nr:hypothetical protein PLICRDRAFT_51534 [Plicaturopsis crispa FD-325 SS-3]